MPASNVSAIRVFLVDDHAVVRGGLRSILSSAPDIEVVGEAGNGREAVRLIEQLVPDVVMMDLSMREMNGVEAVRLLRHRGSTVRVLMFSMHSSLEFVAAALNAGADGYLVKDSSDMELTQAVRAIFAGERYLSEKIRDLLPGSRGETVSPITKLSSRERQVLQLVVEGKSSSEIASIVHLSPKSVDTYRSRLMKKLGVPDITALVKFAVQHGLTPLS